MEMRQLSISPQWEELLYYLKEATRIIHVHKEWVTASLPKVPPVDQHLCHSVHLSCLGSLDHITHGFKSVTHKHQGPAALSLVTCSFLTYFCVLLGLIQLSQQERV